MICMYILILLSVTLFYSLFIWLIRETFCKMAVEVRIPLSLTAAVTLSSTLIASTKECYATQIPDTKSLQPAKVPAAVTLSSTLIASTKECHATQIPDTKSLRPTKVLTVRSDLSPPLSMLLFNTSRNEAILLKPKRSDKCIMCPF